MPFFPFIPSQREDRTQVLYLASFNAFTNEDPAPPSWICLTFSWVLRVEDARKGEMQGEWNVLQLTLSIGSMRKSLKRYHCWWVTPCGETEDAKEMARAFWLRLRIRTELGFPCGHHQEYPCPVLPHSPPSPTLVVGLSNFDVSHQAAPCVRESRMCTTVAIRSYT